MKFGFPYIFDNFAGISITDNDISISHVIFGFWGYYVKFNNRCNISNNDLTAAFSEIFDSSNISTEYISLVIPDKYVTEFDIKIETDLPDDEINEQIKYQLESNESYNGQTNSIVKFDHTDGISDIYKVLLWNDDDLKPYIELIEKHELKIVCISTDNVFISHFPFLKNDIEQLVLFESEDGYNVYHYLKSKLFNKDFIELKSDIHFSDTDFLLNDFDYSKYLINETDSLLGVEIIHVGKSGIDTYVINPENNELKKKNNYNIIKGTHSNITCVSAALAASGTADISYDLNGSKSVNNRNEYDKYGVLSSIILLALIFMISYSFLLFQINSTENEVYDLQLQYQNIANVVNQLNTLENEINQLETGLREVINLNQQKLSFSFFTEALGSSVPDDNILFETLTAETGQQFEISGFYFNQNSFTSFLLNLEEIPGLNALRVEDAVEFDERNRQRVFGNARFPDRSIWHFKISGSYGER